MIRAAISGTVLLLAAATLAAGCSAAVSRQDAVRPAGDARSVMLSAERRVHCGSAGPRPGRLPAGFTAVAAVLCTPVVRLVDGRGQFGVAERAADRGLAPLVAALQRPSAQASPGLICAAQLVAVPTVFLIDRAGRIVRPVLPAGQCGQPQQAVLYALAHVPWITA